MNRVVLALVAREHGGWGAAWWYAVAWWKWLKKDASSGGRSRATEVANMEAVKLVHYKLSNYQYSMEKNEARIVLKLSLIFGKI